MAKKITLLKKCNRIYLTPKCHNLNNAHLSHGIYHSFSKLHQFNMHEVEEQKL